MKNARNILILALSPYQDSNLTIRALNNLTLLIRGDTDALLINDKNLSISTDYKSDQDLILNDIDATETNIHCWVNSMYTDCVK